MIALSNFTQTDRLLQQSVSVSFIDKSVIAKTVCFVQERSHEQKTSWKNLNFAYFRHFANLGQCPWDFLRNDDGFVLVIGGKTYLVPSNYIFHSTLPTRSIFSQRWMCHRSVSYDFFSRAILFLEWPFTPYHEVEFYASAKHNDLWRNKHFAWSFCFWGRIRWPSLCFSSLALVVRW